MRPSMLVQEGDTVKKGRVVRRYKKNPVGFSSRLPASGRIAAINRGERRVLQSVVIALENGGDDQLEFAHYPLGSWAQLPREQVESELIASGLWTALRTRPFSKTPSPGSEARAIFVTAMDTQPLAADPQVIIAEQQAAFNAGLLVLARLTTGKVHVCHAAGAPLASRAARRSPTANLPARTPPGWWALTFTSSNRSA